MQGANRQISERRPPNRGNSACIGKTKPANSPSNFVHETPRAHLRFRCVPAPWLPPLSPSHGEDMRKGGHGGDRSKAGLPAGYWQEKGLLAGEGWPRRSSRSNGCRQRRKICLRKRQQRRRRPTAGSNGPSTEMSSSRPAINCKQYNHARLVSLADSTQMKTQRVLVDGSRVLRRAV